MKKLKVSIGIPAYNEEANIVNLIHALLGQTQKYWQLVEILILSDGSTDNTAILAKSFKNKIVRTFEYSKKRGQQTRQNEIIQKFKGDILVLVEADTLPYNKITIENLIKPYLRTQNTKLAMVVGQDVTSTPSNFFEKIIYTWNNIKQKALGKYQNGDNLYNSGGHTMRALTRNFTNKLIFPKNAPEDCYCYLRLKELGLSMKKNNKAQILTRTINSLEDRYAHSRKFYQGKLKLYKYFKKELVDKEYSVPKMLFLKYIILSFFTSPAFTILAIVDFSINFLSYSHFEFKPQVKLQLSPQRISQ